MDYFYAPPEHINGHEVQIDGEEFSHLVHVMRKKEGDEIRVVDGCGNAYDVRLEHLKKKIALGKVFAHFAGHNESPVKLTLGVGILKNPSKFDFLVEKVTEIGVHQIIPLVTERTIPSHAKVDRWQKLALSAMKQCGRSYLPRVRKLITLDEFLTAFPDADVKIIGHEKPQAGDGKLPHRLEPRQPGNILALVGPEGGFSDEEVRRCVEHGFSPVYFGERKFRTETAAIVISALTVIGASPGSSFTF